MGMFGKKETEPTGLIGIDIGAGGIKAVELIPEKGRLRLGSYGYSEMKNPEKEHKALLDDPKTGAEVLLRILKDAGIKSTRVNASLPSHSVFHAIITVPQPKDEKEDLKPLIEAQVKKLLPVPLEEMILDTTIIDKHLLPKKKSEEGSNKKESGKSKDKNTLKISGKTKARKNIRVLVSGAPKVLVNKYVEMFKLSKLQLTSLETEAFALIRSLII
jgi:Tfp pilus assembly PilM family ATPase